MHTVTNGRHVARDPFLRLEVTPGRRCEAETIPRCENLLPPDAAPQRKFCDRCIERRKFARWRRAQRRQRRKRLHKEIVAHPATLGRIPRGEVAYPDITGPRRPWETPLPSSGGGFDGRRQKLFWGYAHPLEKEPWPDEEAGRVAPPDGRRTRWPDAVEAARIAGTYGPMPCIREDAPERPRTINERAEHDDEQLIADHGERHPGWHGSMRTMRPEPAPPEVKWSPATIERDRQRPGAEMVGRGAYIPPEPLARIELVPRAELVVGELEAELAEIADNIGDEVMEAHNLGDPSEETAVAA